MPLPVLAIIGRANVGKSTFFNRICKSRDAITDDMPASRAIAIMARSSGPGTTSSPLTLAASSLLPMKSTSKSA